jgi:hypothetical protein
MSQPRDDVRAPHGPDATALSSARVADVTASGVSLLSEGAILAL